MQNPQYDYFIIGQGLAGSILAFELIERGKRVLVIDNQHIHSASRVAAGIINPITGHRLNITDNFELFYPTARTFYDYSATQLCSSFFHELKQFRLLKTQGQYEYWLKRCEQQDYEDYLGQRYETHSAFSKQGFGILEILQSGYVDVTTLLDTFSNWLYEKNALEIQKIDYELIEYHDDGIRIGDYIANNIIFCEGYQAIYNPLLKHLPFKLSKGDVLTLDVQNANTDLMLNWGNWLTPNKQQQFKLGSSYVWEDTSLTPDNSVKEKLLRSLQEYTGLSHELIQHQSGIRPTTQKRQPFIGKINAVQNAYCFNGFGSKACLLVPYYAKELVDHLLENKPLASEVTQWL